MLHSTFMEYRSFSAPDFDAMRALEASSLVGLSPQQAAAQSRTSEAALKFFERSEHSFVAAKGGELRGLLLAQSVWQGDKPIVLVSLLLGSDEAREGLLRACVKSAYDTAVYELHLCVPPELLPAARAQQARSTGAYGVIYLGSRFENMSGTQL